MTRKQRRLVLIGSGVGVLAVAVALMLNALRDSIVFFNSPSDVMEKHVAPGTRIRLGARPVARAAWYPDRHFTIPTMARSAQSWRFI